MIATGYDLPFRFVHSDVAIMAGRPVSVRIRTVVPDDAGIVVGTIKLFGQIAITGAFGGGQFAPWDTAFSAEVRPQNDACETMFHVNPCRLAGEAWVVLCHLLLKVHQNLPIRAVEVLVPGDTSPLILMKSSEFDSTYPAAYAQLPFVLNDLQPEGGSYSLFMTLHSPLSPENEQILNHWLKLWEQAILHGGYALAPIDPSRDYVEPYGQGVETYNTTIEWAVFKLLADPVGAINALINLLACFHARCQPLHLVEIG